MKKSVGKRPASKRTTSASFYKKVQSVIKKSAETKSIQFYQDNLPVSDYKTGAYLGTANNMTVIPLTPDSYLTPITQGAGQNQRIGNSITIHKIFLRGMINPRTFGTGNTDQDPSNNEPMPFLLKMWIGYQKDTSYNEVESQLPNFFQSNNTSDSPTGTLMDTFRKVNTDKYVIVATRTYKVGPHQVITTQGTTANNNNQLYANNDFKFCQRFSFDVTKHCIKTVKFNDTNNQPNTRALCWWFEAINPVGTTFTVGRFPAEISYELDIQYKDV